MLTGWVTLTYTPSRTGATLMVHATHRNTTRTVTLAYIFNGTKSTSPTRALTQADHGPISVSIVASDGARIDLSPVDLHWDATPVAARTGDFRSGQKGAIVEFFGWVSWPIIMKKKTTMTMMMIVTLMMMKASRTRMRRKVNFSACRLCCSRTKTWPGSAVSWLPMAIWEQRWGTLKYVNKKSNK